MGHHQNDGVQGTDGLGKGAGVHTGVLLQGLYKEVWHDGQQRERSDQSHVAQGVGTGEKPVTLQAVADVAVAADSNAGDIEDRANGPHTHQEATDLAVEVAHHPTIVGNSHQDEWVWIESHQQICNSQAHHKGIACRGREGEEVVTNGCNAAISGYTELLQRYSKL